MAPVVAAYQATRGASLLMIATIARKMAAFLWAIGREIVPVPPGPFTALWTARG
jgi:hypothetical protein